MAFSLISQAIHLPELAPCPLPDRLPGFAGPFPSTTLDKMGPRAHDIQLWREYTIGSRPRRRPRTRSARL